MSTIEKQNMQQSFVELKNEVLGFIKRNNNKFSKQDFETHYYILKTLDNLIERLNSDDLPSKDKRYATLSTMVVELPEYVLASKIGGKMIDLEKKYLEL